MARWRSRKRTRGKDGDEEVPLGNKVRNSAVVTGLVSHVVDPAVVRMVEIACEASDAISCFGNDAVYSYCLAALRDGLPLPDLGDKTFWQLAFHYAGKRSRARWSGVSDELAVAFYAHYDENFALHDTLRPGYHANFYEYMATKMATNCTNYVNMETLNDHLVTYLRGKYQLRYKSWAQALAYRIVAPEPLNYRTMNDGLVEDRGTEWIDEVIWMEHLQRNYLLSLDNGPLRYRYWMLQQLDTMVALHDPVYDGEDAPIPARFTLVPVHSCGSTRFVELCGYTMSLLLSKIRHTHRDFYDRATASPRRGKLDTYFHAPKKNGWQRGRQVRSNGVELHTLFEKGYEYMRNGRPKSVAQNRIAKPQDFDVPSTPIVCDEREIAAIDVGYHNIFSAVLWTGEYDCKGERVFEKRVVRKTWYDRRSGRKEVRKRSAARTNHAQKRGLMDDITNNTLKTTDPAAFRRAIIARRDAYGALYEHNNNKRFKKLKFAMRQRTERAIDQLVDYISWEGRAVCVIGDCSKTTGFRGCTPGGPVKKIKRLMVKKGMRVVEENEAWSTQSSVCCPGQAKNQCMKNGHSIHDYKNGKFVDNPAKMPRKVHGILICQRCKRTWNRDVVGAINILDIYLARMYGLPRPQRFTRAYWEHHDSYD